MRSTYRIALLIVVLLSPVSSHADDLDDARRPVLHQIWSLDGFQNPDSVVWDPLQKLFFVSNMNGAADAKDGNGFISKVAPAGKMIDKAWVTGLNAPNGLAIIGRRLYTADIDELDQISFSDGAITRFPAPGAKLLTDVTGDEFGRIYVSDMLGDAIYRLDELGKFGMWAKSPVFSAPNAIVAEKKRLIVGSWGKITNGLQTSVPGHLLAVSIVDRTVQPLGSGAPIGNIGGVESDGKGRYFVTDSVAGVLYWVSPSGAFVKLMDLGQGSGHMTYIRDSQILVVPLATEGRLVAYDVEWPDF